jgi:hypothetical protein
MTTTVLWITALAVVAVYAVWVAVPMFHFHRHPDAPPENTLPKYLHGREEEMRAELDRILGRKRTYDRTRGELAREHELARERERELAGASR